MTQVKQGVVQKRTTKGRVEMEQTPVPATQLKHNLQEKVLPVALTDTTNEGHVTNNTRLTRRSSSSLKIAATASEKLVHTVNKRKSENDLQEKNSKAIMKRPKLKSSTLEEPLFEVQKKVISQSSTVSSKLSSNSTEEVPLVSSLKDKYNEAEIDEIVGAAKILCEMAYCETGDIRFEHYDQIYNMASPLAQYMYQQHPQNVHPQAYGLYTPYDELVCVKNTASDGAEEKTQDGWFEKKRSSKETKLSFTIDENNGRDERANIHAKMYREEAQKILKQTTKCSNLSISDRKQALVALLEVLCPHIKITISGKKNRRQFLYDTKRSKRFRTYGEAINSGALDELLLRTGTAVLLRSCHADAEERFKILMDQREEAK